MADKRLGPVPFDDDDNGLANEIRKTLTKDDIAASFQRVGLETPEDPSDQHQFLLFASEGQGHDEPQITQEASINQLDSEEDEIINI